MVEITSRKDLEKWLKGKPIEFAQVIAARAVLRALPYAFGGQIETKWVNNYALSLIRAMAISWAARNFPTHDMVAAAYAARAAAARAAAADATRAAAYAAADAASTAAYAAAYAAYAADAADAAADAASTAADAAALTTNAAARAAVSDSLSADCDWLGTSSNGATDARRLTREPLWLRPSPYGWQQEWDYAATRLLRLDPSYQVWVDWYNRRIKGEDAAFDIPGDANRIEDKAILARLADASDEDFWGKGATYVNTTLQSWIDEARIEARIEEIIRILRGGATAYYGSPEDLAGRAALLTELDRLLGRSRKARDGIGGNYPPDPIDLSVQPVALPEEMREPLEAISTELEKREPDPLKIIEQSKMLHRIGRKLEKMASLAGEEFAKNVGAELGKRVVQGAFWLTLINQILDWLTPLIRIAG